MRCCFLLSLFICSVFSVECVNLSGDTHQPYRLKISEISAEKKVLRSISSKNGLCAEKCEYCCLPNKNSCGSKEQCVLISISSSLMTYVFWIVSFIFSLVAVCKIITSSSLPHQQDNEKIKIELLKKYCNFYLLNERNASKFKSSSPNSNCDV